MMPILRNGRCRAAIISAMLVFVFSGCAQSFAGDSSARGLEPPGPQQSSGTDSPLPVFELHSGFWVNLHHFLYLQARLLNGKASSTDSARGAAPPDQTPVSMQNFPAEEIKNWQSAVAFYAKDLAKRDLLLNGEMMTINNRLSELESCAELKGKSSAACTSGLQPDLIDALDHAAPVYRAHWWAEQDRANREWIAQVAPMVRQMGVELSGQLADVYQRPWPNQRLRVDVVWYGGPFGAYTTLSPVHVTISSHDARNKASMDSKSCSMSHRTRFPAGSTRQSPRNFASGTSPSRAISGTRCCSIPRGSGSPRPGLRKHDIFAGNCVRPIINLMRRASASIPARGSDFGGCWTFTGGPIWTETFRLRRQSLGWPRAQ